MRLFVRLSLIGLVALVAIGFADNSFLRTDGTEASNKKVSAVKVSDGVCLKDGVSMTVDFGSKANSSPINQCVSNFTLNSWDLISAAGLTVTGTQKYPVGFVCRINDFPAEDVESCLDTPNPKVGSCAYFVA